MKEILSNPAYQAMQNITHYWYSELRMWLLSSRVMRNGWRHRGKQIDDAGEIVINFYEIYGSAAEQAGN